MIPRVTNGCTVNSFEISASSSNNNFDTLDFDPSTQQFAQVMRVLPNNWSGSSPLSARFYWTTYSTATAGNVVWNLAATSLTNSSPLSSTVGTSQSALAPFVSLSAMHVSPLTNSITIAGTPAGSSPILFQISRDAANIADTYATTSSLLGVEISYPSL